METYDHIGDAYDLVYADTHARVPFVINKLREHQAQEILELGCGSGLFSIPLKKEGFDIEGLEISSVMIEVAKRNDPEFEVYQGDIRNYDLSKQYDAVLSVSSGLVLLCNDEEIRQSLRQSYAHVKPGGLLWLELPNHSVEVAKSNHTQEIHRNPDNSIIVVIQSQRVDEYWREDWSIFRNDSSGFKQIKVSCDEFLYSPAILAQALKDTGLEIIETYGDLFGNDFDESSSWRRVWVCKKAGSVQTSYGNSPPDGVSSPFPRMAAQRREGTNGPRFR